MTKKITVVVRNVYTSYKVVSKKAFRASVTRLLPLRAELPVPAPPRALGISPHWAQCRGVSLNTQLQRSYK